MNFMPLEKPAVKHLIAKVAPICNFNYAFSHASLLQLQLVQNAAEGCFLHLGNWKESTFPG